MIYKKLILRLCKYAFFMLCMDFVITLALIQIYKRTHNGHTKKQKSLKLNCFKAYIMVGVKRRSSNFLSCIKELIEELKKSDTVLLLERYMLFKQTYIA